MTRKMAMQPTKLLTKRVLAGFAAASTLLSGGLLAQPTYAEVDEFGERLWTFDEALEIRRRYDTLADSICMMKNRDFTCEETVLKGLYGATKSPEVSVAMGMNSNGLFITSIDVRTGVFEVFWNERATVNQRRYSPEQGFQSNLQSGDIIYYLVDPEDADAPQEEFVVDDVDVKSLAPQGKMEVTPTGFPSGKIVNSIRFNYKTEFVNSSANPHFDDCYGERNLQPGAQCTMFMAADGWPRYRVLWAEGTDPAQRPATFPSENEDLVTNVPVDVPEVSEDPGTGSGPTGDGGDSGAGGGGDSAVDPTEPDDGGGSGNSTGSGESGGSTGPGGVGGGSVGGSSGSASGGAGGVTDPNDPTGSNDSAGPNGSAGSGGVAGSAGSTGSAGQGSVAGPSLGWDTAPFGQSAAGQPGAAAGALSGRTGEAAVPLAPNTATVAPVATEDAQGLLSLAVGLFVTGALASALRKKSGKTVDNCGKVR